MKKNIDSYLVILAMILTILFWSSAFVGIRVALKDYSPGSLALFRFLVASLGMVFFYFKYRKSSKLSLKQKFFSLLLGVIGVGCYNICLNYGESTISAGVASFVISLMPVLTTFLAVRFLGETLGKRVIVGALFSLLGILLLAYGESQGAVFDFGVVYLLVSVLSVSFYSILQKPLLKHMNPFLFVSYAIWGGTLALLFFTPQLIYELPRASWASTLSVIYLGIFPAMLAFSFWSYVLSKIRASRAALTLNVMPLLTTVMGFFFLKEVPKLFSFIGGCIALLGAIIVTTEKKEVKENV